MLPDRVSNPGPLTYESGVLPIALRGPAKPVMSLIKCVYCYLSKPNETHGPEVIKLFSCSTQLSMKFFLLINVKMPTIVGILTFMSRKNSILGLTESEKRLNFFYIFIRMSF